MISRSESRWWQGLFSRTVFYFVLGVMVAVGVSWYFLPQPSVEYVAESVKEPVPEVVVGPSLAPAQPTRLRIPRLDMDVPFSDPLGVTEDGAVEVPDSYDTVGWYQYGPTPGALGPAVVLGHVDSYEGPAVFFSLGQLDPGDDIYVDRADGSVAHFKVSALSRHDQSEFPTKAVYGDVPYAGLRLITCTGTYIHSVQRYTHNLIVFAELINP